MSALFRALSRKVGLPEPRIASVRRERDLAMTTRDGVALLADRWIPDGVDAPPLLLIRSPYGRRRVVGLQHGRFFAHHGYQVVIQSCRGSGGSGADFSQPFVAERNDGADCVNWLRSQPWYPGSFATVGASYLGFTQLMLAEAAGNQLRAAVLQITPTSLREFAYSDGMFTLDPAVLWAATVSGGAEAGVRQLLGAWGSIQRTRQSGLRPPLRQAYTVATRHPVAFLEAWLSHAHDDEYWNEFDYGHLLDHFDCPVLIQAGWHDVFLEGQIEQFQRLSARREDTELSIGPWTHGTFVYGPGTGPNFTEALDFLDRAYGTTQPPTSTAPSVSRVRLREGGSNQLTSINQWPPLPYGETMTWHLTPEMTLSASTPNDGCSTFTYDPKNPTPMQGGNGLGVKAGQQKQNKIEARADVLTFTAAPLDRDLHIAGAPHLELTFGSDRPATTVFLRLCEVSADGVSLNITDRLVRLESQSRSADGTWAVTAHMRPTVHRVPAGSRIRVQISSGSYPRYMRHPGTDDDPVVATSFVAAEQSVHYGRERPATLRLPIRQVKGDRS